MTLQQSLGGHEATTGRPGLSIFGASHVGKVRDDNEDAFAFDEGNGLCVVADGMGGLNRGEVASRTVVDTVAEGVQAGLGLADGLRLSHRRVYDMAGPSAEERMGATAVAILVGDGRAHVAWVGDSRAYLWSDGRLQQITKDHSFVQELVDLGVINADEAVAHPNRSVITRAIGVREVAQVQVDETDVPLQPGDRLLLCTDGLSGFLGEAAIAEELAKGGADQDVIARLIDRTLAETEAADNVTAVLISYRN